VPSNQNTAGKGGDVSCHDDLIPARRSANLRVQSLNQAAADFWIGHCPVRVGQILPESAAQILLAVLRF
jgi:hypothetical protein